MSRRPPATVATFVAVATAGMCIASPVARAELVPDSASADALAECGKFFSEPGMDPMNLWKDLSQPGAPRVVVQFLPVPENGSGTGTGRRPGGDSRIFWDHTHDITKDGITAEPCEVLYHELQHAKDNSKLTEAVLDRVCSEIPFADWSAVAAENALRKVLLLEPRTRYNGEAFVGSSFEECEKIFPPKPKPKPGSGQPGGTSAGSGQGSGAGSGSGGSGSGQPGGSGPSGSSPQGPSGGSGPSVGSALDPPGGSAGSGQGGSSAGSGQGGSGGAGQGGSSTASQNNSVFGDPHIVTTDGLVYDLQQVGEFTAFSSKDTAAPRVQVRFSPVPGSNSASMVTAVAIGDENRQVTFANRGSVTVVDGDTRQDVTVENGSERDIFVNVTITADEAGGGFSGSSYALRWADGSVLHVDSTRHWGMRVSFDPSAQAKSAEPRGVLGNFNGLPADDLIRPDGRLVPPDSTADTIRSDFGDPWRISQADSLFAYQPGESTETFTDRDFPGTDPPFPASVTEQAQRVCRDAGVIGDKLFDACVFDVSMTGNPVLADMAAAVTRDVVVTEAAGPRSPDPTPVKATDGPLRDGSRVADAITDPLQSKRFDIDLGAASAFYIADWRGTTDRCDQTFHINFVDVSHGNSPCTGHILTFEPEPGQERFQVEVVSSNGGVGPFSFTVITPKFRELSVEPRVPVSGMIDVRGREDIYALPPRTDQVALSSSMDCATDQFDFGFRVRDLTTGNTEVGRRVLCGGDSQTFDLADPTHRYAVVIDNVKLKTGPYEFVVK